MHLWCCDCVVTGNLSWTGQTRGRTREGQRAIVADAQGLSDLADQLSPEDAGDVRQQLAYERGVLDLVEQAHECPSTGGEHCCGHEMPCV